jgi:hypothetical protein
MLAASTAQTSATWQRAVKRCRARRAWPARSAPGCAARARPRRQKPTASRLGLGGAGAPACLPAVGSQAHAPARSRTTRGKRARLARARPRTHPAPQGDLHAGQARTGTAAASSALRPGPYMPAAPARRALLRRPGPAARAGAPGDRMQLGAARRGHQAGGPRGSQTKKMRTPPSPYPTLTPRARAPRTAQPEGVHRQPMLRMQREPGGLRARARRAPPAAHAQLRPARAARLRRAAARAPHRAQPLPCVCQRSSARRDACAACWRARSRAPASPACHPLFLESAPAVTEHATGRLSSRRCDTGSPLALPACARLAEPAPLRPRLARRPLAP